MLKTGILLTNTGTPDAPTPKALRRYLREFLSDRRIVQLPRSVWLPILYGLILPLRPRRSAKLYKNIWSEHGSPMRHKMLNLAQDLSKRLQIPVEVGMNYGNPSISAALEKFRENLIEKIIVLPLFPQYSNTSSGSSFDRVLQAIEKKWQRWPELHLVREYATANTYIQSLAASIESFWQSNGRGQHLLISFHGIPERLVRAGDPYAMQCQETAQLLADELALRSDQWTLCYQSQFGYDRWLKPSTQALFGELPARGIKHLDVVCPGFSFDCLETLEEIAISGQESFHEAGGSDLRYIPCLNDSELQVNIITQLVNSPLT